MTEKLIDKIRKLQSHADSAAAIGSEAEAQAFAAMVQKMLLQHNLSMADVAASSKSQVDEEAVREAFVPGEHGSKTTRARVGWQERLAHTVAYANFCEILVHSGSNIISFVGLKHNVEVCHYMYEVLLRSADRLADEAYAKYWRECSRAGDVTRCRGFRQSFLGGFVNRLLHRIQEQRVKDRTEVSSSGITALTVINKSTAAIEKLKEKMKVKTAAHVGTTLRNHEGFQRGKQAADDVNLGTKGLKDRESNSPKGELS